MHLKAIWSVGILGAGALACAPLAAQDETAPAADPVPEEAVETNIVVEGEREEDPVVCRRERPPTASRISRARRVCKTQSEWETERRLVEQANEDFMRDDMTRSNATTANTFNNARGGPQPR